MYWADINPSQSIMILKNPTLGLPKVRTRQLCACGTIARILCSLHDQDVLQPIYRKCQQPLVIVDIPQPGFGATYHSADATLCATT